MYFLEILACNSIRHHLWTAPESTNILIKCILFFPLLVHNNELKCSASGQALKSQNPDREVNFYKGEEESYADASNQLMNVGSTKSALQLLTSIIVVVFALKIIA